LQPTSPAIDKGSLVAGITMDERGVIRPFDDVTKTNSTSGNGSDIGAFELVPTFDKDWGYNQFGQLGLGNTTNQTAPQIFTSFPDIIAFSGGFHHSVALRSNGTVVTAGRNFYGELGNGTTTNRSAFGQVLLSAGGTNLSGVIAVSGGGYHNLALKSDGTVWAWGAGNVGQLGNGANSHSSIPVQVGASVAGFNGQVIAVDAGFEHNLALTADGKVWAWGANGNGQIGNGAMIDRNLPQPVLASSGGAQLSGIAQVSAGENQSAALKTDGNVLVWGRNDYGQVGNGTTSASVLFPTATTSTTMGAVTSISAGSHHNVALKSDGAVWVWGRGSLGQIGDNNTVDALTPRQATISNVVEIRANDAYHTLARTKDGSVFAWGWNPYGAIGNGTSTNQLTPLNISLPQGTGGNLGNGVGIIGVGVYNSFAAIPQISVPTGSNVRVEGDNVRLTFANVTTAGDLQIRAIDPSATGLTVLLAIRFRQIHKAMTLFHRHSLQVQRVFV
jgi:alpha-tubulin suppressor-like RCC1 family protein